ncbi:hypothetical protein D3C76_932220 [compost metagenome]
MGHAQYAVDQVEIQLLHASELAELVLDQRLFGGAVHGLDAETAQPRTVRRRFAEDHLRRGCFRCAAGMPVVMAVVGFVDVKGIAHRVTSVKSACCAVKTL